MTSIEEVTLYDATGRPVAYFADDAETIYLWDGHAVAYVVDGVVYAWGGQVLGWYEDEILYDRHGQRVGYARSKCPVVTHVSPVKNVKFVRDVKSVRRVRPVRPVLSHGRSNLTLGEFLRQSR